MLIKTRVLDKSLETILDAQTEISGEGLIEVAKSKEPLARSKGADWTAGAIPFFAGQLVDLIQKGTLGRPVEEAAMNVAVIAWLMDSVYDNVDAETFLKCDLEFRILDGGAVLYDRVPAGSR